MDKKPKRPRDVSQLAKMMVDVATDEKMGTVPIKDDQKKPLKKAKYKKTD